jgi:hypothetical protein
MFFDDINELIDVNSMLIALGNPDISLIFNFNYLHDLRYEAINDIINGV